MNPISSQPVASSNPALAAIHNGIIVYNNKHYEVFIIQGSSKEKCSDQKNLELVVGKLNELIKKKPADIPSYDFKKLSFLSDKVAMECGDGSVKNYQINDTSWKNFFKELIESQKKNKAGAASPPANNNIKPPQTSNIVQIEEAEHDYSNTPHPTEKKEKKSKEDVLSNPSREEPIIDEDLS